MDTLCVECSGKVILVYNEANKCIDKSQLENLIDECGHCQSQLKDAPSPVKFRAALSLESGSGDNGFIRELANDKFRKAVTSRQIVPFFVNEARNWLRLVLLHRSCSLKENVITSFLCLILLSFMRCPPDLERHVGKTSDQIS